MDEAHDDVDGDHREQQYVTFEGRHVLLLAIIAIHIIMGLIQRTPPSRFASWERSSRPAPRVSPGTRWRPIYTNYGKGFKQVANVVHYLEQGAAIGYPLIGVAKAYTLGNDYGDFGPKKHDVNMLALSTSMVPGSALAGPINKIFGQAGRDTAHRRAGSDAPREQRLLPGQEEFLPVEPKPFLEVCKRIANKSVDFLIGLTGMSIPSAVTSVFKGLISAGIVLRYCNDLGTGAAQALQGAAGSAVGKGNDKIDEDNKLNQKENAKLPEGQQGKPDINKVKTDGIGGFIDPGFDVVGQGRSVPPRGGTSNGSPWQQIRALNIMPEFADAQQHRVHVGQNAKHVEQDAKAYGYFSQAEFFFDCAKDWGDAATATTTQATRSSGARSSAGPSSRRSAASSPASPASSSRT